MAQAIAIDPDRAEAPDASAPAQPGQSQNGPFLVIANEASGTNARDSDAIRRALAVLEEAGARLRHWSPGDDRALNAILEEEIAAGVRTVVAAGGDGTAMALADAMAGRDAALAVLPLGTFNYFARGLGLSETPEEAARALLGAERRAIRVGAVNGQIFLNNASLGIYPSILKEREDVYRRFGRRRLMAHWSVLRTFWRFQRPMQLTLTLADGRRRSYRTPLLFVARSAYQLERFHLAGAEAIQRDHLALLIGRGHSRAALFRLAWRLVTRTMQEGRDYHLVEAERVRVETARRRPLLAFDGEKRRDRSPFDFAMADQPLTILLPAARREAGLPPDKAA
ncbi:diacylglycerol/lipid kinase family protein [Pseudooceanicola sp. 200-1SW]|uniref:diacylglycerol/lipid kinase family protein n=1 Tax=Pseudooceanicola sp. 200-1SW TaxID=3425949 RepID=UPI003D7F9622